MGFARHPPPGLGADGSRRPGIGPELRGRDQAGPFVVREDIPE